MITRPLDLSSRLRTTSRGWDALFYVNVALLGLFFTLFGSRFVLSPGVALDTPDFELPTAFGAVEGGVRGAVVVRIVAPGMITTDDGKKNTAELALWLREKAAEAGGEGRLLVIADVKLPVEEFMGIANLAKAAGFAGVHLAAEANTAEGN